MDGSTFFVVFKPLRAEDKQKKEMALIKCPKCGKEMSDRAASCPQCGTSINEIMAELRTPVNSSCKNGKTKRVPAWVGILIIIGTLLLMVGIVWFFVFKPSKTDMPQQSVDNEEETKCEEAVAVAVAGRDDGITALSGEWFCSDYAETHIVLFEDMKCQLVQPWETSNGVYTLKDSVLVLSLNDGSKMDGTIEEHGGEIYLNMTYGWFVPTDD